MTPDELREIAYKSHVPADARAALYEAAAQIERTTRQQEREWDRQIMEARMQAQIPAGFGFGVFGNPPEQKPDGLQMVVSSLVGGIRL